MDMAAPAEATPSLHYRARASWPSPRHQYHSQEADLQESLRRHGRRECRDSTRNEAEVEALQDTRRAMRDAIRKEVEGGYLEDMRREVEREVHSRYRRKESDVQRMYNDLVAKQEQLDEATRDIQHTRAATLKEKLRLRNEASALEKRTHELDVQEESLHFQRAQHKAAVQKRRTPTSIGVQCNLIPRQTYPPPPAPHQGLIISKLQDHLTDVHATIADLHSHIASLNAHISTLEQRNADLGHQYSQDLAAFRRELVLLRGRGTSWLQKERLKLARWKRELGQWWEDQRNQASKSDAWMGTPPPASPRLRDGPASSHLQSESESDDNLAFSDSLSSDLRALVSDNENDGEPRCDCEGQTLLSSGNGLDRGEDLQTELSHLGEDI